MNPNSKLFDSIRITLQKKKNNKNKELPSCSWPSCPEQGVHRAPKGRDNEGEYVSFCSKHIGCYNKSYNYFSKTPSNDKKEIPQNCETNTHQTPSFKDSVEFQAKIQTKSSVQGGFSHARLRLKASQKNAGDTSTLPPKRSLRKLEYQSLNVLNLSETATPQEIRARFKELVKLHHPDLNAGNRELEVRLQVIVEAYRYLKSVELC